MLRLDWATHEAAKHAVERWHYSRALPTPPLVKIGVWENARFIGVVLFSRGATQHLGKAYGVQQNEVCELTRVALREHDAPVTQIIAQAIRMLRRHAPGLRLIVSFADPHHDHHGGIYQAGNWVYTGRTAPAPYYRDKSGRLWHSRQISKSGIKIQYGRARRVPKIADCERVDMPGKHRYLYPLDRRMRLQLRPLSKPYPAPEASDGDASPVQGGEGGSTPTPALP